MGVMAQQNNYSKKESNKISRFQAQDVHRSQQKENTEIKKFNFMLEEWNR